MPKASEDSERFEHRVGSKHRMLTHAVGATSWSTAELVHTVAFYLETFVDFVAQFSIFPLDLL